MLFVKIKKTAITDGFFIFNGLDYCFKTLITLS